MGLTDGLMKGAALFRSPSQRDGASPQLAYKLAAMRGKDESYSDVILRLVEIEAPEQVLERDVREGRIRPFVALQGRPYERAESARKRSSAEGVGCAKTGRSNQDYSIILSASGARIRTRR